MSERLKNLKRDRADKIKQMRDCKAVADKENRFMNGEETRQFDALDKDQASLLQEIEREEKLLGLEDDGKQPEGRAVPDAQPASKDPAKQPEKRDQFETFGEFLQAVHRSSIPGNSFDKRLITRASTGLGEQVPSDGGFLVQQDFLGDLMKRTYDTAKVASRCTRITVSGNGIAMNAIDETSRATGSRMGGITGYWAGESDQKTASKPKFRRMEMQLQKLVGLCYSSDELLEDAPALGNVLSLGFRDEFAFLLDDACINGDGAGKPLGLLASPSLVTVAKESGPQTADTVLTANIVKMRARLWARSRPNAVWFYNQDIEPQLHQLTLGAAGSNLAVYLPGGSLAGQPFDTIMGIPAIAIEQCSTLGDLGDIFLADMSQYLLIEKGGMKSDVSMHVRFIYDESVFRFVLRVNGQPMWNSALTPYKGANTQSPFITLEAR